MTIPADLPVSIRSFIAIELPQEVRDGLRGLREQLQADFPKESLRWVPLEQIHLTLMFLGDILSDSLREMEPALGRICGACAPLRLRIEGLGCFPNSARPKVIWLGLGGDLEPLQALQTQIGQATQQWCKRAEERSFHPHLTIARLRDVRPRIARQVGLTVNNTSFGSLGEWTAEAVSLMRSTLSPQGATHTLLSSMSLGSR
jgi:2'-5' RNA ligase